MRADKVGGWYRLWIKWKDHTEITPRWKSELVRETSNPELLEEIERAVSEARDRHRVEHGHYDDEDEGEAEAVNPDITAAPVAAEAPDVADTRPLAQRRVRRARPAPVNTISPSQLSDVFSCFSQVAAQSMAAFLNAADDYCVPRPSSRWV